MSAIPPSGDGLRPGLHVVQSLTEKRTYPTPLAPSCPNSGRPPWLLSGQHCAVDHALRRAYGITCEHYYRLLAWQGGVCAVCGRRPGKWRLAVDHDHDTGAVRGLCHHRCQRWITAEVVRYLAAPPAQGLGLMVPPAKLRRLEAKAQAKRDRAKAQVKKGPAVPPRPAPKPPPSSSYREKVRALTREGSSR